MYGPVPKAFRLKGASRDAVPTYLSRACFGRVTPEAPTNGTYQPPVGCLNVRRTVIGSTASTFSRSVYRPKVVAPVSVLAMYWYVNTTSSAVNACPSAHFTPGLSLYVTVLPSAPSPPLSLLGTSVARTGENDPSAAAVISGSQQNRPTMLSLVP